MADKIRLIMDEYINSLNHFEINEIFTIEEIRDII